MNRARFEYYFVLWGATINLFLVLHFAKRVDDLLRDLNLWQLVANLSIPLILGSALSAFLAALSALLPERSRFERSVHFLVLFLFLTVNIWSLKTSVSHRLADLNPDENSLVGWTAYCVAMLLTTLITLRSGPRWNWAYDNRKNCIRAGLALVFFSSLAVFIPASERPRGEGKLPNIIIVSFDALSAKHLGYMGYRPPTSPTLDELAGKSYVFESLKGSFNYTPPTLRAIEGQLNSHGNRVGEGLFPLLRAAGWTNQAYFSHMGPKLVFDLDIETRISRSGRNSPLYKAVATVVPERHLVWLSGVLSEELTQLWPYTRFYDDDIFWRTNQYPGELTFTDALNFLLKHPSSSVVWLHLWEPHYPYWPDPQDQELFGEFQSSPPSFINRKYLPGQRPWAEAMIRRYDAFIHHIDREFAKFLQSLKEQDLFQNSILIVTGDHGESFAEGYIGHSGSALNEQITHVPLLIHLPSQTNEVRVKTPASHIDLAPTVLDLLGLPIPDYMPGESLRPYMDSPEKLSDQVKISTSSDALANKNGTVAIYWKNYKLLYWTQEPANLSLFDLSTDPWAQQNIAAENPQTVRDILSRFESSRKP